MFKVLTNEGTDCRDIEQGTYRCNMPQLNFLVCVSIVIWSLRHVARICPVHVSAPLQFSPHTCICSPYSKQENRSGLTIQLPVYIQLAIVRVDTKLSLGITLENRKFEVFVASRIRICGGNLQEKYLWEYVLTDFFRVRYGIEYRRVIIVVLNGDHYFSCVTVKRSAGVTYLKTIRANEISQLSTLISHRRLRSLAHHEISQKGLPDGPRELP